MLEIFHQENGVFCPCDDIRKGTWINLVSPTEEELNRVVKEFDIFPDFIRYPLDMEETSRVEKEEDQLLIIVKVPYPQKDEELVRFETIPLGIILKDEVMITISPVETEATKQLLGQRRGNVQIINRVRFIFNIFLNIASNYLKQLRLIDRLMDEYEAELHRSMRNKELIKLLNLEKSLVYFNTSLKANDLVMARLGSGRYLPITDEDEDILEDAQIENQQAIEMAKIYSDILAGMMDAFASVISNNLNIVMKFLTAVTIVLMLPNLIASIYGMNIDLPLQDNPYAFAILMGISFLLSLFVVYIFIKKKMF